MAEVEFIDLLNDYVPENPAATANGKRARIQAQDGGATSGNGGDAESLAGNAVGSGNGGIARVRGGDGAGGQGGNVTIAGGNGDGNPGGDVNITGGTGSSAGGVGIDGAYVAINASTVLAGALPTSDPANPGQLYVLNGVVMVSV